ncbi:hypothetical protein BYT27DRAFT_7255479 [Phlegmacium glaucopus]|nr:hypothetical protein BYT27DRAFT_7255479 [Phlegmacium glaucopus]
MNISIVNVENLITPPYNKDNQHICAFMSEIMSVTTNIFNKLDKLADSAAAVSTGEVRELQVVLESQVVDDRLPQALLVLKRDLINVQLQNKFSRDVDSIKKELGMESNGNDKLIEKFREQAAAFKMCNGVFEEDLAKMQRLIPWGRHTPENHITHAQTITCQWKIICLVGPPGVGETSIGKTISGRRFFRLSVGGLTDVAKIKGHRRTYVGALPGKIVEIETLLVLVDEVDKLSHGINGETLLGDYPGPQAKEASGLAELDVDLGSSTVDVLVKYYCTESGVHRKPRIGARRRYLSPEPKQPGAFTTVDVGSSSDIPPA